MDHCNICFCNILVMSTKMTKTYDIMIGLRQLLCMFKAEKTHGCNWGFPCSTNSCRQSTKDRNLKFALFERQLNMLHKQYKQALKYYAGNL